VHQIIYRKYIETKQVADDDWGSSIQYYRKYRALTTFL